LCTRFICIIFPSARVRWSKKESWFVFHVSDLSSTPSFIKTPSWQMAACQLLTASCPEEPPSAQSVVWNRVFLPPPFPQKDEK
jgi:hypothetical protein